MAPAIAHSRKIDVGQSPKPDDVRGKKSCAEPGSLFLSGFIFDSSCSGLGYRGLGLVVTFSVFGDYIKLPPLND